MKYLRFILDLSMIIAALLLFMSVVGLLLMGLANSLGYFGVTLTRDVYSALLVIGALVTLSTFKR